MASLDTYKSVRASVRTALQQQNVKDAWARYFKTGLDIAAALYLRAYAELPGEAQAIHAYELETLLQEDRPLDLAWWMFGTVQDTLECEMCKRSTTEKHGIA